MNISKIGVTQVLPKSHPIYKEFCEVAEIRKRVLKDGSIAVAAYNKGRDIADHFRVFRKGTDFDNGDIFEQEILAKDLVTYNTRGGGIVKTIEKTRLEHDSFGQHELSNSLKELYFNQDNELLNVVTNLRKKDGYLKATQHSTKLGQETCGWPIKSFMLEDKNGYFHFEEGEGYRIYSRQLADNDVKRTNIYVKEVN